MKRYILTGTPGCGKTSILRCFEVAGYAVIEEAATDIIALRQAQGIAEPWTHPGFIEDITNLQKLRQMRIADVTEVQFYDRSPLCTYALSVWLGFPISTTLADEMERIAKGRNLSEAGVLHREPRILRAFRGKKDQLRGLPEI